MSAKGPVIDEAHTRLRNISTKLVSKIYPSGIQFRNRNSVSKVTLMRLCFWAFCKISSQSWKMLENSPHI